MVGIVLTLMYAEHGRRGRQGMYRKVTSRSNYDKQCVFLSSDSDSTSDYSDVESDILGCRNI